jgi:hypothetical protein
MAKTDTTDLLTFLLPFDTHIVELALWLREFVWDHYPQCNELIYDNYNAVAVGWSPTEKMGDIFCSFAVYGNKDVHFGFYWGSKIADPEKMLLGKGNQYRYIKLNAPSDFPLEYITKLVSDAYTYSLSQLKPKSVILNGQTIVKSISPKKKRPGLVAIKKE